MNKNARLISYSFIVLLLIFVMLLVTILISYIVYNTFTDWETIIAGCIGFVGAILGGLITLFGVKITINHNNEKEQHKTLIKQHQTLLKIILTIEDLKTQGGILWNYHAHYRDCNHMFRDSLINSLLELSLESTELVYEKVYEFYEYIDYQHGFFARDLELSQDIEELYLFNEKKCNELIGDLKIESKRIREVIYKSY